MWPYYFLVFAPMFFSFANVGTIETEQKRKRIITWFFAILLVLLCLRTPTVGRDLNTYEVIFIRDCSLGWASIGDMLAEPAWFALNNLVGMFTKNYQWLLIVTALITVIPIAYIYRHETVYPLLTISLFITMSTFIMLFSGLRQSVAIALGLIAYEFTKERRFIPYILTVLLAFLFHRSAFMLLFMYPLYYAKITKKWLWVIIPAMLAVYYFNEPIFTWLTAFISELYEGSVHENDALTMLILLVIFCVFTFVVPDESKLDDSTIGMRNFLLLATVIQMFASLNSIAMRMGYYYIIFIPLLLPKIIQCTSVRWRQVAVLSKYVMIVFFLCYFFINAPKSNTLDTFPYRFFWESTI